MHAEASVAAPRYSRANPFPAKLLINRRLSGPESAKDTRHFELDLTGWGLSFEVGDSLAVYATNDPQLVDEIIHALGATGEEEVPRLKGAPTTLREALLRDYSITQPTPKFLRSIAERASAAPLLNDLLVPGRKQDLESYVWGMEVIDFLTEHPSIRFKPQEFVGLLTKLQPRLYSVASSLKAYPDQVHFIVDVVRYESHGRPRQGVCSSFLAERADDVPVPVFPSVPNIFICQRTRTFQSSWSAPGREWHRSVRICKNARRLEQEERTGSFSDRSTKGAILPTARNSKGSRKKVFSHGSIAHGRAIKPRRFMSSI